jgi:hypothetical protein
MAPCPLGVNGSDTYASHTPYWGGTFWRSFLALSKAEL